MSNLMDTYKRLPVAFAKGEGAYLEDTEGKRYLDALSGIAVCGLGHAHPAVTRALAEQAATLIHTSNLYQVPLQESLATKLCAQSGMDRVFFGNSGAEANEAAIKIARLYGHNRGIDVPTAVVMEGSFHGRTMGTLTATGSRKVQAGFEPLLKGFVRAPYGDAGAVAQIAQNNPDVTAILVEPILGEGGIMIPDDGYLAALRRICDEHEWLLMLDEVQTGNGRTGSLFAYQQAGVMPDVVTTAKGLGNGMPIGACLARGKAAEVLKPGNHGSTFGGNLLACAAAHAVLDTLQADGLMERAVVLGERIKDGLAKALAGNNAVTAIRGKGLMIGVEMASPCAELVQRGIDKGVLINVTRDSVVRLLPPLTLTDAEADELVARVASTINDV
ncbi:MAG TPA: aspartate aminotransferase family protein [Pseudomonadales bacterium]